MPLAVIPRPLVLEVNDGRFVFAPDTGVHGPAVFVHTLRQYLSAATGLDLPENATAAVRAQVDPALAGGVSGAYRLHVRPDGIDVTAADDAGLFYAVQTLRQLLPPEAARFSRVYGVPWAVPCVRIEDAPAFQWRGVMLDCSRHFFDAETVKRFIDHLALHKFNVFHWHLTDDQGWRLEIRKYPKLTEIGAWREATVLGHSNDRPQRFDGVRYGGFYTQQQVRDVVAHAAERFVTVVPEIEMPGHSRAAIAAYPELGNTPEPWPVGTSWGVEPHILNAEESTVQFYKDVLEEVLELFPSTFIHVGGDEAVKDEWKASPRVRQRIGELGLADEHELQAWFIGRIDAFLTKRGRRLIGWDEILEGRLAKGATVMSWRGPDGAIAAAKLGHQAVMCRKDRTYLDYYQDEAKTDAEPLTIHGLTTLEQAYGFRPVPDGLTAEQAGFVLGGQAQIWTEYIPDVERLHYMTYPRALAIAEALWTRHDRQDYADFRRRVPAHLRLLQRLGVHGRPTDAD